MLAPKFHMTKHLCLCCALVCLFLTGGIVSAADRHWSGSAGQLWMTAGNWSNNVAPVAGDNLFFSGRPFNQFTVNNFPAGTTFGNISASPGNVAAFTLSGAGLMLTNGMEAGGTLFSGGTTVTCDIRLGPDASSGREVFTVTRSLLVSNLHLNEKVLLADISGSMTIAGRVTALPDPFLARTLKTNSGTLRIAPGAVYEADSINIWHGTLQVDGAATNDADGVVIWVVPVGNLPAAVTGTGVVSRLRVDRGGVLRPGNNGPGIFRCTDWVSFEPAVGGTRPVGLLQVDLNGPTAGVEHDQLVTDMLSLGGQLDAQVEYEAQVGDTFKIIASRVWSGGRFMNVPGALYDTTNGYSLGVRYGDDGIFLRTERRADSPFVLWKGVGPNGRLSLATNWAQGVAPTSGSHVRFRPYGLHATLSNDLPAEVVLASVLFSNTASSLTGAPLTVTQGITNASTNWVNGLLGGLVVVGPLVLAGDEGGTLLIDGSFNGSGTIRKEGEGKLRYVGTTMNSFAGSFVVNGGTFEVDGSLSDGTMVVNGGVLQGTGTVSGVTMNGGTVSPGGSPGVFHINGDLVMGAGATLRAELNGAVPGTGYDQLQVNGTVNLSGATLDLRPGFAAAQGTAFLILVNDSNDAVSGAFAGLAEGAVFSAGGQHFAISYKAGSGSNDVVVTRTAPPTRLLPLTRVDSNTMRLEGGGPGAANYTIQANTNLGSTNWSDIGTVSANGAGMFQFLDTNVQQFPRRFYRTRSP
jgi:hypothetical protein